MPLLPLGLLVSAVVAANGKSSAAAPASALRAGQAVTVRGTRILCGAVNREAGIRIGCGIFGDKGAVARTLTVTLDRVGVIVARIGKGARRKELVRRSHPGARRIRSSRPGAFGTKSLGCAFLTPRGTPIGRKHAFEFSDRFVELTLLSPATRSSTRVFFRRQPNP